VYGEQRVGSVLGAVGGGDGMWSLSLLVLVLLQEGELQGMWEGFLLQLLWIQEGGGRICGTGSSL